MSEPFRVSRSLVVSFGCLFFAALAAIPGTAQAFLGVSPPEIIVDNLLRGTKQTRPLLLTKDTPEYDKDITALIDRIGPDGKKLGATESVLIPKGQPSATFDVVVDASNLANGKYSGALYIKEVAGINPAGATTTGAGSVVGGGATITSSLRVGIAYIVIGEETVGTAFSDLKVQDTETVLPLYLSYQMQNTGNVAWRPTGFYLTVTNKDDPNKVTNLDVSGDAIPFIQPGQTSNVLIEKTVPLAEGHYTARMQFYDQQRNIVGDLTSNTFTVYPPNTLGQQGDLISLTSNKSSYAPGENIMVSGLFKNTGKIPTTAMLVSEIYDPKNALVDVQKSKPTLISQNESVSLDQIFTLALPNNYRIAGHVEYGTKKTGIKTLALTVATPIVTLAKTTIVLWIFLGVLLVLILILFLTWRKGNRKKDIPKPPNKQNR